MLRGSVGQLRHVKMNRPFRIVGDTKQYLMDGNKIFYCRDNDNSKWEYIGREFAETLIQNINIVVTCQ